MNAFISWSKKLFPKKENRATYKIVTTSKQNSLEKKSTKTIKKQDTGWETIPQWSNVASGSHLTVNELYD